MLFVEAIGDAKASSAAMRRSIARGFMPGSGRGAVAYIDAVSLVAIQPICPPEEEPVPEPEKCCLSFDDVRPDTTMDSPFERDGFKVVTLDQGPAFFVAAADLPTTAWCFAAASSWICHATPRASRSSFALETSTAFPWTAVGDDGSGIDRADAAAQLGDPATVTVRAPGSPPSR